MQRAPLFTVWSEGQLVGESALNYLANTSEVKLGDFAATRFGEQLIAVRMLSRQAVCAHAPWHKIEEFMARRNAINLELRAPNGRIIPTDDIEITDLDWLMTLNTIDSRDDWKSDVAVAESELAEQFQPEGVLADPFGGLIPPELLNQELFDIDDVELDDSLSEEGDAPTEFPRYQIQVHLSNGG